MPLRGSTAFTNTHYKCNHQVVQHILYSPATGDTRFPSLIMAAEWVMLLPTCVFLWRLLWRNNNRAADMYMCCTCACLMWIENAGIPHPNAATWRSVRRRSLYLIVPHIPLRKHKRTEGKGDHQAVSLKIIAGEAQILLTQTNPSVEQIISVFFCFFIYPASHFGIQDYAPLCGCL